MTPTPPVNLSPITAPALGALPGIGHGFFTRLGGVSEGLYASLNLGAGSNDLSRHVAANRARVEAALGARHLQTVYQVHGRDVALITAPLANDARPRADALVTATPGLALGILTADCVPVLLADAEARVIGAAHAGWRGALDGVIDAVVAVMTAQGARRGAIRAAIGPAIAQSSYEVGDEVRASFIRHDAAESRFFAHARRPGHWMFGLPQLAAARLARAGVGHVDTLPHDTYADEKRFYSFRRATHRGEADYGRQVSAIMLHEP